MHLIIKLYTPLLFFSVLFSCKPNTNTPKVKSDSTLYIAYAKGFKIEYFNEYKKITVFNPWKNNAIYDCYYLVKNQEYKTPTDGKKIIIPLQKIGLTSGTQLEFIKLLDKQKSIVGIASPHLIYSSEIQTRISQKKIADLGDPFNLNMEQIQTIKPNALFVNGFNQDDPIGKRLSDSGISVVYNNEWMETSLLARSEWIKFVGAFYDKELIADSLFCIIEEKYNTALEKVKNIKSKPTVFCGGNFRGTWYMPAGNSYMANLIKDAGADYFYKNDKNTGSLPLNFEIVLSNFRHADFWIGAPANSFEELFTIDNRHKLFDAVKKKHVFNFNVRLNSSGANDFWESGVVSPDRILEDLIWVFHPKLMPNYTSFYVKRLE